MNAAGSYMTCDLPIGDDYDSWCPSALDLGGWCVLLSCKPVLLLRRSKSAQRCAQTGFCHRFEQAVFVQI